MAIITKHCQLKMGMHKSKTISCKPSHLDVTLHLAPCLLHSVSSMEPSGEDGTWEEGGHRMVL